MEFITFPEHVLLIVEEWLREPQAEGVMMPEGMELDEAALRIHDCCGDHPSAALLTCGLDSKSILARGDRVRVSMDHSPDAVFASEDARDAEGA